MRKHIKDMIDLQKKMTEIDQRTCEHVYEEIKLYFGIRHVDILGTCNKCRHVTHLDAGDQSLACRNLRELLNAQSKKT